MQSQSLIHSNFLIALAFALLPTSVWAAPPATEPPVIPIGLDAYRMWERWPEQRIGVRAYMRSTYDRRGGNEGADASHFLYQLGDTSNVTLDVAGPGVLYFARYNHWHGSPWHYTVDGTDHIVQESSTADPNHPAPRRDVLAKTASSRLLWPGLGTRPKALTCHGCRFLLPSLCG